MIFITKSPKSDLTQKTGPGWENILLQITLPIVLVLAFISLTKLEALIRKYEIKKAQLEKITKDYEKKKKNLERLLTEYKDTPVEQCQKERIEAIINEQKQKIIKGLGELRYEKKLEFGIYKPFEQQPSSKDSNNNWRLESYLTIASIDLMRGGLIDDKWQSIFKIIYDILRRKESTNFEYYKYLLRIVDLEDDASANLSSLLNELGKTTSDSIENNDTTNSKMIFDDNRKFAYEHLNDFINDIEKDTIQFQQAILNKIIDHYIYNIDDLDTVDSQGVKVNELKELIKEMDSVPDEIKKIHNKKIADMIIHIVRDDLENRGYYLLDRAWMYK